MFDSGYLHQNSMEVTGTCQSLPPLALLSNQLLSQWSMNIKNQDLLEAAKIVDQTTATYIKNLPATVEKMLNMAVYNLLGLAEDYNGKLKIDHCNGNRSFITKVVEEQCKSAIADKIAPVVNCALTMIEKDKEALAAIATDAARQYRHTLAGAVDKKIREAAEARAAKVVQALEEIDLAGIFPINTDEEDPESFQTDLGHAMLEELAKRTVENGKAPKIRKVGKTYIMDD